MAVGESFLAGINTAQRLGLQRQSINIARQNMEANRAYYENQTRIYQAQENREAEPDRRRQRVAGLVDVNSVWDFKGFEGFGEGSFAGLDPAQHDTDKRFMARAKEAEQFQALDASPLGDLIKKSATVIDSETGQRRPQTEEELAQIYRDRKVTDDTLLSQDPLYQQSDGQEAVTARMKSHTDKVRFMAEYMTDFLGSELEGDEFVTYYANPDGTYTPMVRPKGSNDDPKPLTEGRSSEGDDPVIKVTPEELQRQFETAVQDDIALGGLENPQARYKQFEELSEKMRQQQEANFERDGSVDAATDPYQGGGDFSMYGSPSADGAAIDDAAIEVIKANEARATLRLGILENTKRRKPEVAPFIAASLVDMTLEELIEVGNNELGEGPVKEMLAALATQQEEMRGYARGSAPRAVRGDNIPDVLYNQGDDYFLQTHEEIPTSDLTLWDASIALATGDTAEAWKYIKANPSVAAEISMWVLPTGGLLVAGGAKVRRVVKAGWKGIRDKYGAKVADMLEGLWKKTHTVQRQGATRYGVENKVGQYMIRHPSERGVISAAKAKELGMTPNREFSRWRATQTASLGLAVGEHTRRAIFNESDREKAERYLNNSQTIMRENSNISWVNRVLNPALNDNLERVEGFPDSTHLLRAEVDELGEHGPVGHWYAFPEIIEEDGKLVKLSAKEAFDHAMFQKTAIDFGLEGEEARRFAEGNYKSRSFLDHFKNRHETEGVLRGAIGSAQEARQVETERQIVQEARLEDLRVAEEEQRLISFDAVTAADATMVARNIEAKLAGQDATPNAVRKVIYEMPPKDAMAAIWAIVANSPKLSQAERIALADDLIAGVQTGQIGMTPFDVADKKDTYQRTRQQEDQLDQNAFQLQLQNERDIQSWSNEQDDRRREAREFILDQETERRQLQGVNREERSLALSIARFDVEQVDRARSWVKEAREVVGPLVSVITKSLINAYNNTQETDARGKLKVSEGTTTANIRELIGLASSSTETPEIIAAAQSSLAEILALVIVHEGKDFPQDSFLEKIWRSKGNMPISEIANNLYRTAGGTRIAFRQPGRADVQQGEASVYRLRGLIGDGMLRQILANLPEADF